MRYLSVCSGIEAATVAWPDWTPVAFSEIEPFPSAVLAHHYPTVPNWGDMTKFQEWPDAAIDLLVGGTPCQSFSVAGLRKGMADPRGNLALTYLAIADRYRPDWVVWENVPGVLSSAGGRDFGAFLGGLAELGYGWAYRVLDAQYFGLAQRRRRVFVVGSLRGWTAAAAVLFERESLRGHPAPGREAREGIAAPIAAGASTRGGYRNDADTADNLIAHALRADGFDASEAGTGRGTPLVPDLSLCLNAGGMGRQDWETETLVMDAAPIAFHHNAQAAQLPGPGRDTRISDAITCSQQAAVAFTCKDSCHPLAAGAHPPALAYAIQGAAGRENPSSGPDGIGVRSDNCAYTIEARQEVQAVAATLRTGGNDHKDEYNAVPDGMQVRRLTPRECERLQGFPDDYTLIPHRGKPAADGPRYKALGNSMAVPCMAWIGQRIALVQRLTDEATVIK